MFNFFLFALHSGNFRQDLYNCDKFQKFKFPLSEYTLDNSREFFLCVINKRANELLDGRWSSSLMDKSPVAKAKSEEMLMNC